MICRQAGFKRFKRARPRFRHQAAFTCHINWPKNASGPDLRPRSTLTTGELLVNILIFEDSRVDELAPVTMARPAWSVSCGADRLIDGVQRLFGQPTCVTRGYLENCAAADFPTLATLNDASPWTLCINARLAPRTDNWKSLKQLASAKRPLHCHQDEWLLAALIPTSELLHRDLTPESCVVANLVSDSSQSTDLKLDAFHDLHDYIRIHLDSFEENIAERLARPEWHEIAEHVFCDDADFRLPALVATDTTGGPIVISAGCQIRPFVFLKGPLFIGANNRIAEHASIKEFVSTGTTCKLGGELESTIFESYSNKQHHGFLGHSYVGSWVNLGAGTCNSDLKNTYGTVNMLRGNEKVATNMQFLGCFIGDYAKTAINASIYTGKTLGVCSMLYGTALTDVLPFSNHAPTFGQTSEVEPDVLIRTQQRMFARRNVTQRPCDSELIAAMFQQTAHLRTGLVNSPLSW